jgi:hypothetical protein
MPKWLIILLVVLIVVFIGCCGGIATCYYAVGRAGSALSKAVREGTGMSFDGTLPASFPKDVPIYSGFKPTFSIAPAGQEQGAVTLTGKGDPSKIGEFYEKALADNGWKQTATHGSADEITQTYTKDTRTVSINATSATGSTTLVITYGKKEGGEEKEPVEETPTTPPPATPRAPGGTRTPPPGAAAPTPPGDDDAPAARPANNAGAAATPSTPAAGTKLPANFPSDVPVYSGLTPGFSFADKAKGSGSVMLSGKVDKDKAQAYYEKELAAKGWKQEQNTDIGAGSVLVYSKEGRKLSMTIIPEADKGETMVTISYEKSE